jgi:hypothetical protein
MPDGPNGGTVGALDAVISQIKGHIKALVLPLPSVQRGSCKRLFIPEEDRRSNRRIAHKPIGKPALYLKKAQLVFMTRLGMCEIEGEPQVDCLEWYAAYFEEPLPPSRIDGLAKLFFLDVADVPRELLY